MNTIYIAYNNWLTHQTAITDGCGCSELQITLLSKTLSDIGFDVVCFNQSGLEGKIDNILFRNYDDLLNNRNINTQVPLIFWRFFDNISQLINFYDPNKIILWSQDYMGYNLSKDIVNLINKYKIHIIAVSEFHKTSLVNRLINPLNISVIYNALYTNIYKYLPDIVINKNIITFASASHKGLATIIKLFDQLHIKYPNFKLNIIEPSYMQNVAKSIDRPYIQLCENIKDKIEFCKIIQSSLCTISTEFPETFGCVFAESYFLKTPVIATNKINGMHEFINPNHTCDLNKYHEFENLLLSFYNRRPDVDLNQRFLDTYIVDEWKKLLLEKIV